MVDVNKPVTNPDLVKSVAVLREEPSRGNEQAFFHELLKAHFLAPVIIDPMPENTGGESVLEKDTKIQFAGITTQDGKTFFPAFTDWDELRKWSSEPNQQTLITTFKDYESMLGNGSFEGVVINPFGENLLIDGNLIEIINNSALQMDEGESVMIGIPNDYPTEMIDALKKQLPKMAHVKSAYLLLMVRNQTDQSFLMVVDTENDPRDTFAEMAEVATPFLKKNEKLDFVPLGDSFGKDAVKDQSPFYVKKENKGGFLKGLFKKR
ncbi:enhanced serine sensitivity protein SseB [Siminovitchia fortis]|nr:enhanced serine sensitivity protein SseB [Siminovitchia fortis]